MTCKLHKRIVFILYSLYNRVNISNVYEAHVSNSYLKISHLKNPPRKVILNCIIATCLETAGTGPLCCVPSLATVHKSLGNEDTLPGVLEEECGPSLIIQDSSCSTVLYLLCCSFHFTMLQMFYICERYCMS